MNSSSIHAPDGSNETLVPGLVNIGSFQFLIPVKLSQSTFGHSSLRGPMSYPIYRILAVDANTSANQERATVTQNGCEVKMCLLFGKTTKREINSKEP